MKDGRLRRHPLMALRERLRGGTGGAGDAAKRSTAAATVAVLTASASAAVSTAAKVPEAPLYYLPPVRAAAAVHRRAGPQLLSDQLYETVHPLLFSSASPSISGIASSGGEGDSLMLGGRAAVARAGAGGPSVSSVANSSVSTQPDSGGSPGERRKSCDCDFCQRVAAADLSQDITAIVGAAATAAATWPAAAAGSDLTRSETIDWYNVSAEIEAAAAAATASAAPASAVPPSRDRGTATVGDSTREFFGDEVRLTLQSSAAVPSTIATAAAASSTPHQRAQNSKRLGESAMPPYSRQLLARLMAEPSPSTTANTEGGRDGDSRHTPSSSSPSVGSFVVGSPLRHNSRCSPAASGGLTDGAPVNPDLAGLDFSGTASSCWLVGSAATPTSTSSLLSATPPPPPPPPPPPSAPSMRHQWPRSRLPPWGLQRIGPAQSPTSTSSYKSSLVPSSTESSLSGCRPGSLVLTPPPGFGSPTADVTVVAIVSSSVDDTGSLRGGGGGGGGVGSSAMRLRRVRRMAPPLRRAKAFANRVGRN